MGTPRWFVYRGEDPHNGQWHLAGWMLSAIKGEQLSPEIDGWLRYGICPRCFAMVVADEKLQPYGDQTWAHEQWHAETDYPVPVIVSITS
jgi:hypothetical protein